MYIFGLLRLQMYQVDDSFVIKIKVQESVKQLLNVQWHNCEYFPRSDCLQCVIDNAWKYNRFLTSKTTKGFY